MSRTILAFALAPLSFGTVMLLLSIFLGNPSEGLWAFLVSAIVSYPIAAVVGVPVFMFLNRLKLRGLISYILSGSFTSAVPIIYFVIYPRYVFLNTFQNVSNGSIGTTFAQASILLVASLVTVTVFWLIARPDKLKFHASEGAAYPDSH